MTEKTQNDSVGTAKLIYILQIVSTLTVITGIIGVIMAYVNKDDSNDWMQSHYQFQIRTFWISTLYIVFGTLTFYIGIGIIILLFTFFWIVIRCAKGLKSLSNNQAIEKHKSWMFG